MLTSAFKVYFWEFILFFLLLSTINHYLKVAELNI